MLTLINITERGSHVYVDQLHKVYNFGMQRHTWPQSSHTSLVCTCITKKVKMKKKKFNVADRKAKMSCRRLALAAAAAAKENATIMRIKNGLQGFVLVKRVYIALRLGLEG